MQNAARRRKPEIDPDHCAFDHAVPFTRTTVFLRLPFPTSSDTQANGRRGAQSRLPEEECPGHPPPAPQAFPISFTLTQLGEWPGVGLGPQNQEQCLVYSRCSMTTYRVNMSDFINEPGACTIGNLRTLPTAGRQIERRPCVSTQVRTQERRVGACLPFAGLGRVHESLHLPVCLRVCREELACITGACRCVCMHRGTWDCLCAGEGLHTCA